MFDAQANFSRRMKLKAAINREVRNGSLRRREKDEGKVEQDVALCNCSAGRGTVGKAPTLQMRLYVHSTVQEDLVSYGYNMLHADTDRANWDYEYIIAEIQLQ